MEEVGQQVDTHITLAGLLPHPHMELLTVPEVPAVFNNDPELALPSRSEDQSLVGQENLMNGSSRNRSPPSGQNGKMICNHQCLFCEKSFTSTMKLESHMNVHTKERPYFCNYCKDAFSSNNVRWVHEKIHLGQPQYKCDVCEKMFTSPSTLYSHRKRDHKGMPTPNKGSAVKAAPNQKTTIVAHKSSGTNNKLKLAKKKKLNRNNNNAFMPIQPKIPVVEESPFPSHPATDNQQYTSLTDSQAQFALTMPANPVPIVHNNHYLFLINKNYENATDTIIPANGSLQNNTGDMESAVNSSKKVLTCASCSKTFSNESALNLHVMRKHGSKNQRPYRCEPCEKAYCTMAELNRHNVRIHSTTNDESLKASPAAASRQSTKKMPKTAPGGSNKGLQKSAKKSNSGGGEKVASGPSNACQFCQESFNTKRRLNLHMTVEHGHKNVQSFQCEHCQKGFYTAEDIKSHVCIYQRPHDQWAGFHMQSPDSSIIKIQNVTMDSVLDRQLLHIICE